ncbi:MAG: hypothetical protein ACOYZ6_07960 [Chloroflexota bacterium]
MKRSKSEIELAPIMGVLAAGFLFLLGLLILAAEIAEKFGG